MVNAFMLYDDIFRCLSSTKAALHQGPFQSVGSFAFTSRLMAAISRETVNEQTIIRCQKQNHGWLNYDLFYLSLDKPNRSSLWTCFTDCWLLLLLLCWLSPECRSIKEHYRPIIFNSTTELLLTLDTSTHYRPISCETEPIVELQFESRVKPTLQVVN